jgi:hemerythrin superfamily protein
MADTKLRAKKATALLRNDHKEVKNLFSQYEDQEDGDSQTKQELFEEIKRELTVHATIEEEIFYPALDEVANEEARKRVIEAREEHKVVKTLLEELSGLDSSAEEFDGKMKVLIENVRHHAEEEEEEMFPHFDELPKERQNEVSEQLRERKAELSKESEE